MMTLTCIDDIDNPPTIDAFDWGEGLDAFPENGSITSLEVALRVLNKASRLFDKTKRSYLAFDTSNYRFINCRPREDDPGRPKIATADYISGDYSAGETDPGWWSRRPPDTISDNAAFALAVIDLPSVGNFDEKNWRSKLRQLASNISQLKALERPVRSQRIGAGFGDFGGLSGIAQDQNTSPLEWTIKFPQIERIDDNYVNGLAYYFSGDDDNGLNRSYHIEDEAPALYWTVWGSGQVGDGGELK